MRIVNKLIPHLILTTLTVIWWRVSTSTSNYAWFPKGKEQLILDTSLTTIFIYKVLFWLTVGNIGLFAIVSAIEKKRVSSMVAAMLTVLIFFFGGQWVNKQVAFSYFVVFKNQSVTEENIERPILESGYFIGDQLTPYILDKSSKYRRYAISGLSKVKYKPATTTLKAILFDTNESDFIRADALVALKSIGTRETKEIVEDFDNSGDKTILKLSETFLE